MNSIYFLNWPILIFEDVTKGVSFWENKTRTWGCLKAYFINFLSGRGGGGYASVCVTDVTHPCVTENILQNNNVEPLYHKICRNKHFSTCYQNFVLPITHYIQIQYKGLGNQFWVIRVFELTDFVLKRFQCIIITIISIWIAIFHLNQTA